MSSRRALFPGFLAARSSHRLLLAALLSFTLPDAPLAAAERAQPEETPYGLFVLPDNVTERDSERTVGDYVSGAPVILSLRLVNVLAKRRRGDARPVTIPRDWARSAVFSLADGANVVLPGVEVAQLDGDAARQEGTIELYDNEVEGRWAVSGEATAGLEGEYSLVARWKDASAVKIVLRFRRARTDDERARVRVGQARLKMALREFAGAVELLEGMPQARGEPPGGDFSAAMLLGDALAASGRTAEALKLYEGLLAAIEKQRKGPRDEAPEALLGRIGEARRRLQ